MSVKHACYAAVILLLVVWLRESRGCFITNCRIGGKRSLAIPYRQCLPCGPQQSGQCIGPGICCGETFGCLFNTKETITCRRENSIPTPCVVIGERCVIHDGGGHCTAYGVCCNERGCVLDDKCKYSPSRQRSEQLLLTSPRDGVFGTGGIDRYLFTDTEK